MDGYRISQLAERAGMPVTTLRYYETRGLLPARRTPAGYRTYDDTDVERVRVIAMAKDLGLSLDRIRELLGVWQNRTCRDVRTRLLALVEDRIADAGRRIDELGAFRDHLYAAVARLDALPPRDAPCDPACASLADDPPAHPVPPPQRPAHAPPVACTLPVGEYAGRTARWRHALSGTTRERLPDDGIRVRLPAERAGEIAMLAADESRCCAFFTFRLTVTADGVELDAHAPAEAAPLLQDLFAVDEGAAPAC